MRSILALGSLIALCTSANAAKVHHSGPSQPRHVIVRPSQDEAVPPGWYKFPGYPPIPPEQNRNLDPSNFGGGWWNEKWEYADATGTQRSALSCVSRVTPSRARITYSAITGDCSP